MKKTADKHFRLSFDFIRIDDDESFLPLKKISPTFSPRESLKLYFAGWMGGWMEG